MPQSLDVYVQCDDLDNIPPPMRENYLYETQLLSEKLPKGSSVLQVGSMDGERAIRLLKVRPDLKISGLEIEASLVELARQKIAQAGVRMENILGDITNPPNLPQFDYVVCLNNTLGYIPEQQEALAGMGKLGKKVVVSVYGEKFTNDLAKQYFRSIGLSVDSIQGDNFIMKDFTTVKRYDTETVQSWGGNTTETPVGYFCELHH
jgi:SAM-dependent methyltransferase